MASDEDVWSYIRTRKEFVGFTEVKDALGLSPERLTRALRRLERAGELYKTVGYRKEKPVNIYLAIDAEDPSFRVRIVDDHGWLLVIFEWLDGNGLPSRSTSETLGELADYLRPRGTSFELDWPPWAGNLATQGRLTFEESWAARSGYGPNRN